MSKKYFSGLCTSGYFAFLTLYCGFQIFQIHSPFNHILIGIKLSSGISTRKNTFYQILEISTRSNRCDRWMLDQILDKLISNISDISTFHTPWPVLPSCILLNSQLIVYSTPQKLLQHGSIFLVCTIRLYVCLMIGWMFHNRLVTYQNQLLCIICEQVSNEFQLSEHMLV